jgi:hypothetical protein
MNKLILLFLIGAGSAMADSSREQTIYNAYNNYLSEPTYSTINNDTAAALSAAADQHHFDWATNKWQASAGVGQSESEQALSVGAAKRYGALLFTGAIQQGSGARSLGMGVTGRF